MKFIQSSLIALMAAASFYALPAGEAKAESRFHLNWMLPGFPPPPPRRHYYYYPDAYEDEFYGDEEYDEEVYYYPYYDEYDEEPAPRYQAPQRKKSKAATAYAAPDEVEPAPKAKKKPSAKPTTTAKPKATSTAASVSCDKAKSILAGYGFGDVETKSCSGEVYSFAAKRGGKTFSVRVSALNGELTEVKRQ
jgi:hypothetical protein